MRLVVLPQARADLVEIARFGRSRWGEAQASRYAAELRKRMMSLAVGHLSGVPSDDVAPGLRRQVAESHVIWFRILGDRLRVIRVLHGSQDAARHLDEA